MEAASGLLYGVPIHQYVTMDMSGVIAATDAVGGISLEVLDDFTAADHTMEKGVVMTLSGKQARIYVKTRIMEGLDGKLQPDETANSVLQGLFYGSKVQS